MTEPAWLMAVATGICNSGVALAAKAAERSHCRAMPFAMALFAVAGLTALLFALGGDAGWGDWRLWAFGGVMGALYLAAMAAMLRANRCWPPSIVWSAANMGFVVPILLSAVLLGEALRWVDVGIVTGVVLMLVGLSGGEGGAEETAAQDGSPPAGSWRWLPLSLVFVTNGVLMLGYKLFGVMMPGERPAALVTTIYACGAVLAAVIQAGHGGLRLSRAEAGWGMAAGLASGLAGLALLGAMKLPAAAAFPVVQGTSLTGGVLLCAWVFGERLTPRKLVALAIGLGAMLLTLWR